MTLTIMPNGGAAYDEQFCAGNELTESGLFIGPIPFFTAAFLAGHLLPPYRLRFKAIRRSGIGPRQGHK
jgi:hypothetical protein